jgi:2-octaprenyl-6-methoxyphenol hydroxylase
MVTPPARMIRYRIVGSGPVALACALFMVRSGIDPARIGLRLPAAGRATAPDGSRDLVGSTGARRMIALSDGSRQLLTRVIGMPGGGVIERIEVAMAGRSGRTRIDAQDFKVEALGHVIAYPDLVAALRAAADRLPFAIAPESEDRPYAATATTPAPAALTVTIHADGIAGPVAPGSSVAFSARDFNQVAVLTEVVAEAGGTTAYECFDEHGPLALLPAGAVHGRRYAVVWCDRPELSAWRAGMTPAQLSAALNQAVARFATPKAALGTLQVCAPAHTAPLSRLRRIDDVAGREVWIGNAAQSLHPVAGQGLNLGLRDAFELARSLAGNEYLQEPLAPERVLSRFAASRRIDRRITTGVTDLLASAFTWPLAQPLQSLLLTAMDVLPVVRRPLASTLLFGHR